ncbi:uncharacterized protein LOC142332009 [Lycorma delicatula]|uniref:uncharacterized protein LOC142332009 n=1 Tax=Lycorma delicatula TaxID=130591 RepID=UPI003F511670
MMKISMFLLIASVAALISLSESSHQQYSEHVKTQKHVSGVSGLKNEHHSSHNTHTTQSHSQQTHKHVQENVHVPAHKVQSLKESSIKEIKHSSSSSSLGSKHPVKLDHEEKISKFSKSSKY